MKKVVYVISDIDKALAFEWIADQLNRKEFALSFVLLNSGDSVLEQYLIQRNIPVTRIEAGTKAQWPSALWQLVRIFWRIRPSVVHCHLFTASILGLSAARIAGVPNRIFTRHHSDFHYRYFPKGVRWDRLCNRLATKIVAPSGVVRDVLVDRDGVAASKVIIVHHGFDLEYFRSVSNERKAILQSKYNPGRQAPVIGVISRFTELKGIQFIIPAFSELLKSYPNALLLLFNARGDYASVLEQQLRDCLPDTAYKTVPFEVDLAGIYTLMDVFVQVSIGKEIEAFGQTYVEAMAARVPMVCTLAGIANDFVCDGENAVVVPFSNSEAILEGLQKVLSNPDFAEKICAKGFTDISELFDLKRMIAALEALYR